MVIVYIIGIILFIRLFNLQIVNGAEYRENSNTRLSRESTLEATRGDILDSSGNVLATTKTTFNISLYKTKSDDETLNKCILNLVNLLIKNAYISQASVILTFKILSFENILSSSYKVYIF